MNDRRPNTALPTYRSWGSRHLLTPSLNAMASMNSSKVADSLKQSTHMSESILRDISAISNNDASINAINSTTHVPQPSSTTTRLEQWRAQRAAKSAASDRKSYEKAIAREEEIHHVRWLRSHTEPNGHLPPTVRDDVALPSFIERVHEWGGEMKSFRKEQKANHDRERTLIAAAEGQIDDSSAPRKSIPNSDTKPLWRELHDVHNAAQLQSMQRFVMSNAWRRYPGGLQNNPRFEDSNVANHSSLNPQAAPADVRDSKSKLGSWLHIASTSASRPMQNPTVPSSLLPPSAGDPTIAPHYGLYEKPHDRSGRGQDIKEQPSKLFNQSPPRPPPYPKGWQRRKASKQFHFSFEEEQLASTTGLRYNASLVGEREVDNSVKRKGDTARKGVVSVTFPFPLF